MWSQMSTGRTVDFGMGVEFGRGSGGVIKQPD